MKKLGLGLQGRAEAGGGTSTIQSDTINSVAAK